MLCHAKRKKRKSSRKTKQENRDTNEIVMYSFLYISHVLWNPKRGKTNCSAKQMVVSLVITQDYGREVTKGWK